LCIKLEIINKLYYDARPTKYQDHLFGSLKQALSGRRFTTDQQLDVTVHAWLVSQPKTFYSEVIEQIVR